MDMPELPSRIRTVNPDTFIFAFLPPTNAWSWDPYKVNGVLDPTTGCGQMLPGDKFLLTPSYQLSKAIEENNFWLRAAPTNGIVIVNPHNAALAAEGEIPSIPAWDAFLGTDHYDGFVKTIRPAKVKVRRGTKKL